MSTDPVQGFVLPGTLSVTVTDPNVSDHLYVRWIAEYPPYNEIKTRNMGQDAEIPPSADGTQVVSMQSFPNVDCSHLAVQTAAHPITALVTDRPFLTAAEFPNLSREDLLTKINDAQHALKAEAHWVLNVDCP